MKGKKWIVLSCLLVLFIKAPLLEGQAASIQSSETDSSITFTGRYEPIGTPNPPPDIAKPPTSEKLPQTNTLRQNQWLLLGWLFVIVAGSLGIKRKTKTTNRKEGNY